MDARRGGIPRFGLHRGLFGLHHTGQPWIIVLVLAIVVVAVILAVRNSRGR